MIPRLPCTPSSATRADSRGAMTVPSYTRRSPARTASLTAMVGASASSSSTAGCPGAPWDLRVGPLFLLRHGARAEQQQQAPTQQRSFGPVKNDPYCGRSATRTSRIVGGNDAYFGQFPWQAVIQVGGSRCGGALVGRRFVVTAGHCVARSQHKPSNIRVTLGDYVLHSNVESLPAEVFGVSEVRLHPNFRFTPQADRFDVAVVVLDRPAPYRENIRPICIPSKGADFLGRTAYAAGWGALEPGSKLRPKVLQFVPVPIINNKVCETWHRKQGINIRIHDEMMCAGYEYGGKDACQGDSGGPLMMEDRNVWYLIGIVSAGYSCAKQYQPGIYHKGVQLGRLGVIRHALN
ncbi:serine proteinase stubble [Caerostris extrusa]|uniref:Serine proteinase stubble n=1 Tax=Caerostris extrusa TaxID=172846 RepID=A0AAV4MZ43_CAEEX|nr:serine proteinase stubble [Caerostris extrusa]